MVSNTGFIESPQDDRDIILGCPKDFQLPKICDYSDNIDVVKNQGSTMKCVPYSLSYVLELQNKLNGESVIIDIDDIYDARTNDNEGMAIRDALKYVKKIGYGDKDKKILSYGRLNSILAIKYNLLMNGPCLMALPVYSDRDDFWNGSDYQGGHAICCIGYDNDSFILLNSWGPGFGYNGKCHLPFEDINRIIEAWGIIS